MKKENKNIMKNIKILTIILLIVLVSMIGFFGIYKQNKNQMSNIVKDYSYAMDLNGARTLKLTLNSENGDDVKTADMAQTLPYTVMLLAAFGCFGLVVTSKKRQAK